MQFHLQVVVIQDYAVGSASLLQPFGLPSAQRLFTRVWRGDTVTGDPLSHRRLREILKAHMAAYLPDDGLRRSSHAFRIGSAQSLARAGGSLVDLQTAGRWRDPSMPARYCKGEMARRGRPPSLRQIRGGGRNSYAAMLGLLCPGEALGA